MGFVIAFQVRDKASVLILLIMFLRSISSRSEKSSSVVAVLNSHLQRSACESSKYRKSYFAFKRINILNQRVRSFVQGERFKVSCAPTAPIVTVATI